MVLAQAGAAGNDRIVIISKIMLLTGDGMVCRDETQAIDDLPVAFRR